MRNAIIIACALTGAAGCQTKMDWAAFWPLGEAAEASSVDVAAAEAELRAVDLEFAAMARAEGAQAAFAAYMDPDESRYILGGSDIVRGAEAIGAVFAGMGPDSVLSWEPIYAEAAASGDLGYTIGTWRLHPDGDDPAAAATGKYVTIWRKTPDGDWRGAVDIGVTDPPPAPSE